MGRTVHEPAREVPIVDEADVVVVGGGPAGIGAAMAAARLGARVLLVERYGFLGGAGSGSLVLVWDDCDDGCQKTVGGVLDELVQAAQALGGAMVPDTDDLHRPESGLWAKWGRWGFTDWFTRRPRGAVRPITWAACVDPEVFKHVAFERVLAAGTRLRLHSWLVEAVVQNGAVRAIIVESKSGRQALAGRVFVDASGDGDLLAAAGAPHVHGRYLGTLAHRLADVDLEEHVEWERRHSKQAADETRAMRAIYNMTWEYWWLYTVRRGVIWANCPTWANVDGLDVGALTELEVEGRRRIFRALDYARAHLPGFRDAYVADTAAVAGIRQTRLLKGAYRLTLRDVKSGRRFPDAIGRARNYWVPYRALYPAEPSNLLVAGRCYSATAEAQRMSREISGCLMTGQAAGAAAGLAVKEGVTPREVDVCRLQAALIEQGVLL
ncbi:MAG TPA: FAD-dependent oxidoreductase [Chloroflexota bacterium]|nr:FAD-dependent oxidoreductase [Chloroflexota bacterium]